MLKQPELKEIVKRAKKNEPGAFEELCQLKAKNILYIASKIMGDSHEGEDVAQEVMLQIYHNIVNLKKIDSFNSWMYKLIIGECNKARRKIMINEESSMGELIENIREFNTDFIPQEYLEQDEKQKQLAKAVDMLREKQKLCVLMFYYEGMSYEEIAAAMNLSKKDVANQLQRAKESIRRNLGVNNGANNHLYAYSLSALSSPALVKLFQHEAAAVSVQYAETIVQSVLSSIATESAAAAGTSTLLAGAKSTTSIGTKIATVITSGALVITAGTTIYINNQQKTQSQPGSVSTTITVIDSRPAADVTEDVSSTSQLEIKTLEDMIGIDNAATLRKYAAGGGSLKEIQSFLTGLGMEVAEQGESIGGGNQLHLFSLTKEPKMLQVITQNTTGNQDTQLVFRFTSAGEPMPEMDEMMTSLQTWR